MVILVKSADAEKKKKVLLLYFFIKQQWKMPDLFVPLFSILIHEKCILSMHVPSSTVKFINAHRH